MGATVLHVVQGDPGEAGRGAALAATAGSPPAPPLVLLARACCSLGLYLPQGLKDLFGAAAGLVGAAGSA